MITRQGTPPWTVMAVFDPDGTGGEFAYTIGLAELISAGLVRPARTPRAPLPRPVRSSGAVSDLVADQRR